MGVHTYVESIPPDHLALIFLIGESADMIRPTNREFTLGNVLDNRIFSKSGRKN